MSRYYYANSIDQFLIADSNQILGALATNHEFALEELQRNAWLQQIVLLKQWLNDSTGTIIFEYTIPRMGRRVDCIILSKGVIFVIEFKVGTTKYDRHAIDQVVDYALDLKNFHAESHHSPIVPILICTGAEDRTFGGEIVYSHDQVAQPLLTNGDSLAAILFTITPRFAGLGIDPSIWINSIYKPTPTIVEAAQALYSGHSVEEISRSDAGAINLSLTSATIANIIAESKAQGFKSICFLTGVPGAGKTLAGLNLANSWHDAGNSEHAVFLSGNGPLVMVLREALARNEVQQAAERGEKLRKAKGLKRASTFIQNIHHFRDDSLESEKPPIEKVVIFDEAQRAWDLEQTVKFMKRKKGRDNFSMSEPEFLISVMNRHHEWATIVCLVGGGQEINTGEAGMYEWFDALGRSFPDWRIYVSDTLSDSEYTRGAPLLERVNENHVTKDSSLHLSVSVRSYRSEKLSEFVKAVLDLDATNAATLYAQIASDYPIRLTRSLEEAKQWLGWKARGSERYGIVASSGALRLKPLGINVRSSIDPTNWFLNDKSDVRSSYYLEDVATEFDIQGLELDWACVAWDANLRIDDKKWKYWQFRGTQWQRIHKIDDRLYLLNTYRVLLTRARQGMIIFVPYGSQYDPTRLPEFYDQTFSYLAKLGIPVI